MIITNELESIKNLKPAKLPVIDSNGLTYSKWEEGEWDSIETVDSVDSWSSLPSFISDAPYWGKNTPYGGIQMLNKNINDITINYTPSLIFPGFKCINIGVFGDGDDPNDTDYPNFIIFSNDDVMIKNITAGKSRYSNPASNNSYFVKTLGEQIKSRLISDRKTYFYKFLIWTAVIDYLKPEFKPYENNEERDPFCEDFVYFNMERMFPFPSDNGDNIILRNSDVINIGFKKFVSAMRSYVNKGIANELVSWFVDYISVNIALNDAIDDIMINDPDINEFPAVIDEEFGMYSTTETILNIVESIDPSSLCNFIDESNKVTISDMADYDAPTSDNPGWFSGDTSYFSISEYGTIFGNALNEVFSLPVWKDYNDSVGVNFILDHWCISKDSDSNETTGLAFAGAQSRANENVAYMSFSQIDVADLTKNDIRYIVRDSRQNSIYNLEDYNWSMDPSTYMANITPSDYQHLVIYEFQQDRATSFKRLADGLLSKVSQQAESESVTSALTMTAISKIRNTFVGTDTAFVKSFSTNVDWVDQVLDGYWVGQYMVPYFGDFFIKSGTSSGWSMGNLAEGKEFIMNDLTINAQDIPTWKFTSGNNTELDNTFYLINDTIEDTIKNLKFLFAFAAGTYWLQDNLLSYRAPNLYRVFCPSRFVMLYAAMDIDIKYFGKIRRYSFDDARKIFGTNDAKIFKRFISGEKECNIPDAYEISIKLKDLTPAAFNVFASYHTASQSNIYPKITTEKIIGYQATTKAVESVANSVSNLLDAAAEAMS